MSQFPLYTRGSLRAKKISTGSLVLPGVSLSTTVAPVVTEMRTITETTGAGVYTASVTVPAAALILDMKLWSTVLWTASTSATGKIGDVATPDGWFIGVNMKATDLLVGEEINFIQTGGKEGVYLVLATGLRNTAYAATARVVSCIVTTVGTTGNAGRSFFAVVYALPSTSAATKV
jgi:hypothetical protein